MPQRLLPPEEAHIEGAVPLLNNLALLQHVFKRVGITDVGLSDLVDPQPRRSRRLFAALVSWFENHQIVKKYQENKDEYLKIKATKEKLSACTAKVNKLRASLASSSDKRQSLMAELGECSRRLAEYETKKVAVTAEFNTLNVAFCASKEALQRAKMEL